MTDFVFIIGLAIALPLGFLLGCAYVHYKYQDQETNYTLNYIKEEIIALNVKFEKLTSNPE